MTDRPPRTRPLPPPSVPSPRSAAGRPRPSRAPGPGDRVGCAAGAARGRRRARRSRSSARPTRRTATSPRNLAHEARPAVPDGAAGRSPRRWPRARRRRGGSRRRSPVASVEVAPPGLPQPAPRATRRSRPTIAAVLRRPGGLGPRRAPPTPRARQRRVRVGQPDRPAPHRQRPRRLRRRPALPRPRGRRPARSRASTTSTTSAARSRNLGASVRGASARASRAARGRLPRRLRRRPRRRRCPTTSGPRATEPGADAAWTVGRWASERVRAGIEASLEHLGVHFDVWTSESSLHDEGWVERAVERLRERGHVYERGRRDLVPLDRLRRRQGPGHPALERASRPTSRPTSATWSRSSAAASTTSSTSGAPTTTARSPGSATPPRRWATTASAVQMLLIAWVRFVRDGEEISMSKRAGEFITLDELLAEIGVDAARWFFASRGRDDRHRLRHRAGQEAVEREPGLLRPVRARPDRLDPAQGGRGRAWRRRPSLRRASLAGAPEAALARAGRCACPRSSRTRPRPRRRRASRPTPPSWRPRSTPSTATRGSSTPEEPERSAARLALVAATQIDARRTPWRCWGSPRPSRCSPARRGAGRRPPRQSARPSPPRRSPRAARRRRSPSTIAATSRRRGAHDRARGVRRRSVADRRRRPRRRTRRASAGAVPGRLPDDGPGAVGPS